MQDAQTKSANLPRRRGPFSGLTQRIVFLNILALAVLVGGILYFNQFRTGLIESRLTALVSEAQILAAALSESSVVEGPRARVDLDRAQAMLRRLTKGKDLRARLFLLDGTLAIDSRSITPSTEIVVEDLPPPGVQKGMSEILRDTWVRVIKFLASDPNYPPYRERLGQVAADYPEVLQAFEGETNNAIRVTEDDSVMLTVAAPIQQFRRVLGGVLVSAKTSEIEEIVRQERLAILQIFGVAVAVTALFSLLLAKTIARPVRRLAQFARQVRQGRGMPVEMPKIAKRRDEVGELSQALQEMTEALYQRIGAIENFAADVAHEIKNPLTSLRSAVETFERTDDPEKRVMLLDIVKDDIKRLDRLISDISNASRLDAELMRAEIGPVDVPEMLRALTQVYDATAKNGHPSLELAIEDGDLTVEGIEDHLGQVIRNLVDNAISFSPPGGKVKLSAIRDGKQVIIAVEDDGPGLPSDKIEAIFERFYSERPGREAFGTHSGLGLNIAKEIVVAHNGTIVAENRPAVDEASGEASGARFAVVLPVMRTG